MKLTPIARPEDVVDQRAEAQRDDPEECGFERARHEDHRDDTAADPGVLPDAADEGPDRDGGHGPGRVSVSRELCTNHSPRVETAGV